MMDIQIELDPDLGVPLYKQLSNKIEGAILSGSLRQGDRLPPTRELSANLNMARRTVVKAYDELLSKGYLEGKVGVGTSVSRNLPSTLIGVSAITSLSEVQAYKDYRLSSFGKEVSSMNVFPLMISEEKDFDCTPAELLPIQPWRRLLWKYSKLTDQNQLESINNSGFRPLREAVSEFLARTKGVICHPDQVILFSGPQQTLNQIVKLLVDQNDTVVVENPGSLEARKILLSYGARLEPVGVDEEGLLIDQIAQLDCAPRLAYVTPSCQNPTAVCMSNARRTKLLSWAIENDVLIVEDALDSDYRYGYQQIASLQGLSPGNVIYFYSFHKLLFPLTNLSAAIVPPNLVPAFLRVRALADGHLSVIESRVLTDFIREGFVDSHIRRTRRTFQQRRQKLMHALSTCFRQAVSFPLRSAGTHIMVRFSKEFDRDLILDCADRCDLPIACTSRYYLGGEIENEFLIPFSRLDQSALLHRLELFAASIAMSTVQNSSDSCFDGIAHTNS